MRPAGARTRALVSEVELKAELDDPRIVARGDDTTKVARARADDLAGGADADDCVEVADWVGQVDVVKQIEEFGAKLHFRGFAQWETLGKAEVYIDLTRPA